MRSGPGIDRRARRLQVALAGAKHPLDRAAYDMARRESSGNTWMPGTPLTEWQGSVRRPDTAAFGATSGDSHSGTSLKAWKAFTFS